MFDSYIIDEASVRNVTEGDEVVGFAFNTRISYYRGLGVSMIEPFEVRVDGGEIVPPDRLRFTIGDHTWTWPELETDYESRWELIVPATLTVLVPQGLAPGEHTLEVSECLRISYLPFSPARTTCTKTIRVG